MTELAVGQSARQRHVVVLTKNLHLPRASPRKLRTPHDASLRVFERNERKPFAHGHRAELAEAFAERARAAPRALEMQFLDALRFQSSLRAPDGPEAMCVQTSRCVIRRERRKAAQGKAAQHFERDGFRRPVRERTGDFKS